MKFAALSFGIGISGVAAFPKIHAKIGNAVKKLGKLKVNFDRSATDKDLLKKKTSGCPPSFPFKIAPNFPNSEYDLCYKDSGSANGGSGPCGSWCATAGDWPRVESLWGDTCGSLCPSTDVDGCEEGKVLVHVAAHPRMGKFCVKEDDPCRKLKEKDDFFCRRAGEGSRLSIATSQTKCDASNCGNWDCDAWCKCFNEADEKDGIYTSNDCDDDGDEECKCLVDYGEEKSARSCGKNFFKPTEGRPAIDGTGCEMCTEFNSKKLGKNNSPKCDLEFNTITKCTATQDAVCTPKPKKVCYEMQHYQWRMKDGWHHCESWNWGREWTFKGHFSVNGEAYHTQCKHVGTSYYNTGYHESYHGSNIAVGEYTPGMKVTMGYESWENDYGDVCKYDADYHLGYTNMGWFGTIDHGWTNHGDDCHQHKNQEFTVPTSHGHNNQWRVTTLNSGYTSMKVRTRTWEAYSCK